MLTNPRIEYQWYTIKNISKKHYLWIILAIFTRKLRSVSSDQWGLKQFQNEIKTCATKKKKKKEKYSSFGNNIA